MCKCPFLQALKVQKALGHTDLNCQCPTCTYVRIWLAIDRTFFDGADDDDDEEMQAELRRVNEE
jgi:hypothetical protein